MPRIQTRRLELISATVENLRAKLTGPQSLATSLHCDVPATWPPQFYDDDAIRYSLDWLQGHPDDADWGFYYVVLRNGTGEQPLLVGAGGFKGAPDDSGMVEIGYAIVADQQRQGFAAEAVEGLLTFAFASPPVSLVVGQTLPSLLPSIGVLKKAGFRFVGSGHDPHAPAGEQVIRYEMSRADFVTRIQKNV